MQYKVRLVAETTVVSYQSIVADSEEEAISIAVTNNQESYGASNWSVASLSPLIPSSVSATIDTENYIRGVEFVTLMDEQYPDWDRDQYVANWNRMNPHDQIR